MSGFGLADYRGGVYRLEFVGVTKGQDGAKAKLVFPDGSTVFWVSADRIRVIESAPEAEAEPKPDLRRQWRSCGQSGCAPHACSKCGGKGRVKKEKAAE